MNNSSYSKDVSIIIVNYNTTKLLLQAIDSVFKKSIGFSYEIIIVDNNSADNPEASLRQTYRGKVVFIRLLENIGFGRANNEGIKIAKGHNIFLLNTDTYLVNNAIFILMDYLNNHPKVGSCGGNLFTTNLEHTYSYHKVPYGIWSYELSEITLGFSRRFIRHPFFNTSDKPISVGNVSGANMMLRHDVIKEVGAFDPIFFMYCEESELSWRIKKAGYKNVNVPQAEIVHLCGQSFTINKCRKLMELDGRKKYYIKTRGMLYFKIANIMLFTGVNVRIFFYKLRANTLETTKYKMLRKCIIQAYF